MKSVPSISGSRPLRRTLSTKASCCTLDPLRIRYALLLPCAHIWPYGGFTPGTLIHHVSWCTTVFSHCQPLATLHLHRSRVWVGIQKPQVPYWGGYIHSSCGHSGSPDQDSWPLVQQCLPTIHSHIPRCAHHSGTDPQLSWGWLLLFGGGFTDLETLAPASWIGRMGDGVFLGRAIFLSQEVVRI